jgi:hypothetical protein
MVSSPLPEIRSKNRGRAEVFQQAVNEELSRSVGSELALNLDAVLL